jgi:hypothetical protein
MRTPAACGKSWRSPAHRTSSPTCAPSAIGSLPGRSWPSPMPWPPRCRRTAVRRSGPLRRRKRLRRQGRLKREKPLGRRTPLRRSRVSTASDAQLERVAGQACLVCGRRPVDPAHLVPRSLGGCDDPDCAVPLDRRCHGMYDRGEPTAAAPRVLEGPAVHRVVPGVQRLRLVADGGDRALHALWRPRTDPGRGPRSREHKRPRPTAAWRNVSELTQDGGRDGLPLAVRGREGGRKLAESAGGRRRPRGPAPAALVFGQRLRPHDAHDSSRSPKASMDRSSGLESKRSNRHSEPEDRHAEHHQKSNAFW